MYVRTTGTDVRVGRFTILPAPSHPDGHGACSERKPCVDFAAAYAVEDEQRDTVEDIDDGR